MFQVTRHQQYTIQNHGGVHSAARVAVTHVQSVQCWGGCGQRRTPTLSQEYARAVAVENALEVSQKLKGDPAAACRALLVRSPRPGMETLRRRPQFIEPRWGDPVSAHS